MNKIIAITTLCLLAAAALADTKAEIMAKYDIQRDAYKHNNVKGMFSVCTPDYWEKDSDGKRNLKQAIASVEKYAPYFVSGDTKLSIDSLKQNGNMAFAHVTVEFVSVWKEKDKKTHIWKGKGTYADIWIKTPKGWMIKSDLETSIHMTRDGKSPKAKK